MAYELEFSPTAEEDIQKLSDELKWRVHAKLLEYSESPAKFSRPAPTPPFPPGYQAFQFDIETDEGTHHFTALFKYRADESTLWVYGFSHQPPPANE